MPRTSVVECPGCPPIRAITFDILGLIKVIEGRGTGQPQSTTSTTTTPKVVERWGEPDSSRSVLTASIDDRKIDPLLAVARKDGRIEVLNPLNGELRVAEKNEVSDDPISGLHLFRKESSELSSRSCTLLTCTVKGNAVLRSLELAGSLADSNSTDSQKTWNVCAAGNVLCSAVDGNENYALFGGKGVEVNVWDLETCTKTWNAKSPPKNSLDIFTPTWFTAATFLSKEDHRKIAAGTNSHQVRLYDISAQRRPVISFDFRESAIKSVAEDLDGHTIYFGTGAGDLGAVDLRTGKLLGCFLGKCSGSIRSIVRHPEFPVIASCGLDSYLRFWDVKTRQLLSAVFLKQHLTKVVIDSNFSDKETPAAAVGPPPSQEDDDDASLPVKRKKASKESEQSKKLKSKKKKEKQVEHEDEDDEEQTQVEEDDDDSAMPVKRKKASKESEQSKKLKSKKKEKQVKREDEDDEGQTQVEEDEDDSAMPVKRKKTSRDSEQSKKLKSKKKKEKLVQSEDEDDERQLPVEEDDDDTSVLVKSKKVSKESEQSKKLKPKKRKEKRVQHENDDDES